MAAPASKSIHDLNGKWVMNKQLSDDFDAILSFQGIGWLTRKTIGLSTITVVAKQYKDAEGKVHIDIDQIATGGIKGTPEPRTLDWVPGKHSDQIFGEVEGRTRFVKVDDIEPDFGKGDAAYLGGKDWDDEEHVQSYVVNQKGGWTANQIWGFKTVGGERRHVRMVVVTKKGAKKQAALVYDFVGEL